MTKHLSYLPYSPCISDIPLHFLTYIKLAARVNKIDQMESYMSVENGNLQYIHNPGSIKYFQRGDRFFLSSRKRIPRMFLKNDANSPSNDAFLLLFLARLFFLARLRRTRTKFVAFQGGRRVHRSNVKGVWNPSFHTIRHVRR